MKKMVDALSSTRTQQAVQSQLKQLQQSFIIQWLGMIELAKSSVNIADTVSIQSFLDELQAKYGKLEQLEDDIIKSDDDRFAMVLEACDTKPNNKQFALAQYIVGKL